MPITSTVAIHFKDTDGVQKRVAAPFLKTNTGWKPAKMVLVKTDAGWQEVWPGEMIYTHVGTGYALNAAELFGNPAGPGRFIFINNGVIGGANQGTTAALTTGSFPVGSTLKIINNGKIRGMGGSGGAFWGNASAILPTKGGTALVLQYPATIDNTNGTIFGGGGGGVGAGEWGGSNDNSAPGGGGAGIPGGVTNLSSWHPGYWYPATVGSELAGGYNPSWGQGYGGAPGAAGGNFTARIGKDTCRWTRPPGAGGSAITGAGYIISSVNLNVGSNVLGSVS